MNKLIINQDVLLKTPMKSTILTKQLQGPIHEMEKLFMWIKMIKLLERLKNTGNKYMADTQPDRLTACQSERKSVVSRRPNVLFSSNRIFYSNCAGFYCYIHECYTRKPLHRPQ
jgi:hypothetical protein